jgi:uridine phosphorylase
MREAPQETPLLWDTSRRPSAFEPEHWIEHCERVAGRPRPSLPEAAVQTLDGDVWSEAVRRSSTEPDDFTMAGHPFVVIETDAGPVAVGSSAKGSYAAGALEELIALGVRSCVVVGGAGDITGAAAGGDLAVPRRALADDGVACHYVGQRRYVDADGPLSDALEASLAPLGRRLHAGAVWTISAHFRETRERIAAFRREGCLTVDNESAGVFAVGLARGAAVARLLVIGDSIAAGRFSAPVTVDRPDPARLLDAAFTALSKTRRVAW